MWRRSIAVVMLGGFAGCSIGMSGPDANRPLSKAPECDTGKGTPTIDGFMGVGFGVASIGLLAADESSGALITGLIATAYVAAAIHGNNTANDCRKAFAEYNSYRPGPEEPQVAARPAVPPPPVRPPYRAPGTPAPEPAAINDAPPPAPEAAPTAASNAAARKQPAPPVAKAEADDWTSFWTEVP